MSKSFSLKGLLILFSIISFIASIIFGFLKMEEQMKTMTFCFFGFLIFAHLDKFKSFSLSTTGLEAKMKHLDSSIESVQEIAIMLSTTELTSLSRSGMFGGISNSEKGNIKNELLKKLRGINVSEQIIENTVLKHWHDYTQLDYYLKISNKLYPLLNRDSKRQQAFTIFKSQFQLQNNNLEEMKPSNEIEEFLLQYEIFDSELNELVADYKFYEQNKKHRAIESWLN